MKPADLKILVKEGEGTTLEFKEGISTSLARGPVALTNTVGGKILLGVKDELCESGRLLALQQPFKVCIAKRRKGHCVSIL
jgi:predicted HTH transcriptional regulator